MFEIKIRNFRCIEKKDIIFEDGMILFKGENGVGKSTILESIRWCIFGNFKNVHPRGLEHTPKDFTKVKLIIKDKISVTRKKPPETVIVEIDGKKFHNSDAEKIIDNFFGSKGVWLSKSYIPQGEKNFLLISSAQEKLNLIKEIIFLDDNPETYNENVEKEITKTKEKLNFSNNSLELLTSCYEAKRQNFDDEVNQCEYDVNALIGEKNNLEKIKIQIIENNLSISRKKQILEDIVEIKYDYPEEDLLKASKKFEFDEWIKNNPEPENPCCDISDEFEVTQNIENLRSAIKVSKEFNVELRKIPEILSNLKEIIKFEIEKDFKISENNKNLKLKKKFSSTLNELESENNSIKNELGDIEWVLKLDALEIQKFYQCPECETNLEIRNDKLIKYSDKKVFISKNFQSLKKFRSNNMEIEKIKDKLKNLTFYEVEGESKTEEYKKQIDAFSKLKIPDNTLRELKEKLIIISNQKKFNEWKKDYDKLYIDFNISISPEEVRKEIKNITINKKLQSELKKITILNLPNIENINEEILSLEEKIRLGEKNETIKKIRCELIEMEEKITILKSDINKFLLRLNSLNIIKNKINDAFHLTADIQLNNINDTTNEILNDIFDNEISLNMSLFKEYKNKKESYRNMFNIDIEFKGENYDNISFLSYGEREMVSLGLTIAISYISNSPFIIFDECMAYVSARLRPKCLEAMRKYLPDKPVINVCHETVEGYYDQVIEI